MFLSLESLWTFVKEIGANREEKAKQRPAPSPRSPTSKPSGTLSLADRARLYLDTMNRNVCGQGKCEDDTFHAACELVIEFELTTDEAFPILRAWCDEGTHGWTDSLVWRKLYEADAQPGPRGRKANADWTPPKSAEQLAVDAADFQIWWGDSLHHYGPGGTFEVVKRRQAPAPEPVDVAPIVAALELVPERPAEPEAPAERPAAKSCPHCHKIRLRHRTDALAAIGYFPCQRLACPYCGAVLRDEYKDCYRRRLQELRDAHADAGGVIVYIFRVSPDEWDTVRRRIGWHGGEYFRLDDRRLGSEPGETQLVCSTVKPLGRPCHEMTPEAAAAFLCLRIDAMAAGIKGKVWWASRGWKLYREKPDKESQWMREPGHGKLGSNESAHLKVLADRKRAPKFVFGARGFWGFRMTVFSTVGLNPSRLWDELDLGETFWTERDMYEYTEPAPAKDEWATTEKPNEPAFRLAP